MLSHCARPARTRPWLSCTRRPTVSTRPALHGRQGVVTARRSAARHCSCCCVPARVPGHERARRGVWSARAQIYRSWLLSDGPGHACCGYSVHANKCWGRQKTRRPRGATGRARLSLASRACRPCHPTDLLFSVGRSHARPRRRRCGLAHVGGPSARRTCDIAGPPSRVPCKCTSGVAHSSTDA
jgi:hypothetical protein